ncbi:MAG: restriction endonuclease subunit S, partial [Verrucomicrobiales bacterium]
GQTLFGKRRAYQRKAAYAEFDAICSSDILVFEAQADRMLPAFLPFIVQSNGFFDHALGTSAGSLSPRTNWRDLANFEFNLPPLEEQGEISDLLWSVENSRTAVGNCQRIAQETYERTRIALLMVGPNENWTEAAITATSLDQWTQSLPAGWTAETLSSVGSVRSGATPSRSQQSRYFDGGGIPWVKTLDLNEGVITRTEENVTDTAVSETSAKVFPAGTVLVAMYGGFAQIGRTARLGVDAATNQAVSAITNLRDDLDPRFLHEVLKAGRPKWRKVAASSRKDPNITKKDIEGFDFPLPPMNLQLEVLDRLAWLQAAIDAFIHEMRCLDILRASFSSEIFGGDR